MRVTFEARNYRAFRHVRWSPEGVCALVGPNGSGKTTLLRVPEFLRHVLKGGMSRALKFTGGIWGLRYLNADMDDDCQLSATVEDVTWEYSPVSIGGAFDLRAGECVKRGEEEIVRRRPHTDTVTFRGEKRQSAERPAIQVAADASEAIATELKSLIDAVRGHRLFRDYAAGQLRNRGSLTTDERAMDPRGINAFSVLRNWRDKRSDLHRYHFVVAALRQAFPHVCDDLEFDMVAQSVSLRLVTKLLPEPIPVQAAPDGWLTGLLHLTAVAGSSAGATISFDEFENSLHPYAIRKLIEHFRYWSHEHDVNICLATHSPVVIDEFNDEEERERLFVLEPGQKTQPVRVTELADHDWLRQFTLGRLYSHGDIGSPTAARQNEHGQPLPA